MLRKDRLHTINTSKIRKRGIHARDDEIMSLPESNILTSKLVPSQENNINELNMPSSPYIISSHTKN